MISGIFWLKLRDLSKNLIRRPKRTADAVGFCPPCTRSGFSGAIEAQLARSQRRWKVDILGFPAIYDSPYFAQDLMAQTGVQSHPQKSQR